MEKSANLVTDKGEKIMFRKNKHHYFHHTSRRYEDEKFKERFAIVGLIAGGVLGSCTGGIVGAFSALVGGIIILALLASC